MDEIVFEKLKATKSGWEFEAHLELDNDERKAAFEKAFAGPFELPILKAHDDSSVLGVIRRDATGKIVGNVDAVLFPRMQLGIGFQSIKWRMDGDSGFSKRLSSLRSHY